MPAVRWLLRLGRRSGIVERFTALLGEQLAGVCRSLKSDGELLRAAVLLSWG